MYVLGDLRPRSTFKLPPYGEELSDLSGTFGANLNSRKIKPLI